jgi:hypothetical protein
VLFEKAVRPPPAGSLLEALFTTVWLRRQEIEILKTKSVVAALTDVLVGKDNQGGVAAFKSYYEAALPFLKKDQEVKDKKLLEVMKKEAAKGPLYFNPIALPNKLRERAQTMSLPDDFRKRLIDKARSRK